MSSILRELEWVADLIFVVNHFLILIWKLRCRTLEQELIDQVILA